MRKIYCSVGTEENKQLVKDVMEKYDIPEEVAKPAVDRCLKHNEGNPLGISVKDVKDFINMPQEDKDLGFDYKSVSEKQREDYDKRLDLYNKFNVSQINSYVMTIVDLYNAKVNSIIERARVKFPELISGDLWKDKATVVKKITPKRILNEIFKELKEYYANYGIQYQLSKSILDEEDLSVEDTENSLGYDDVFKKTEAEKEAAEIVRNANNIIDHFDTLVQIASSFLKQTQPVSITNKNNEVIIDNERDDSNDDFYDSADDLLAKDDYQKESYEMSVWSLLSPVTKDIVNNIVDLTIQDGEEIVQTNTLGGSVVKSAKVVVSTLLGIVSDITEPSEMMPILKEKAALMPWIQQIVDVLTERNTEKINMYGTNVDQNHYISQNLQALFWKDFHKPFMQFASIDMSPEGTITIKPEMNVSSGVQSLMNEWRDNITNGNRPNDVDTVYGIGGVPNIEKIKNLKLDITNEKGKFPVFAKITKYNSGVEINDENRNQIIDETFTILSSIGAAVSKDQISEVLNKTVLMQIRKLVSSLSNISKNSKQSIFNSMYHTVYRALAKIFENTAEKTEENRINVEYDDGTRKTVYSHSFPNPIRTLLQNFHKSDEKVKQFIDKEFRYDFHYKDNNGDIPNIFLREIYNGNQEQRDAVKLVQVLRSFGKPYMKNTKHQQALSQICMFVASQNIPASEIDGYKYAFYDAGTFADTKANYYISNKVRSVEECKQAILDLAFVELERMVYVGAKQKALKRTLEEAKNNPDKYGEIDVSNIMQEITYYDRSCSFYYLPGLNEHLNDILDEINNASEFEKKNILKKYVDEELERLEKNDYDNFTQKFGISPMSKDKLVARTLQQLNMSSPESFNEKMHSYFYNQFLAKMCIQNMLIVDPAFCKNKEDLQKRMKMFYSPMSTAYTSWYLTDENGNLVEKVVDGRKDNNGELVEFFILLNDEKDKNGNTKDKPSRTLNHLKTVMRNLVKKKKISKQDAIKRVTEYSEIKLSDGQAMRVLDSWHRYLNMIGKGLDSRVHEAIKHLEDSYKDPDNKMWSLEDYETVHTVMKPFVAGYMQVNNDFVASDFNLEEGSEESQALIEKFKTQKVPFQHKNSEFLLLAAYEQIYGCVKQSPKMRALNKFMNDYGIDKAQFVSASKVGIHGVVDIDVEVIGVLRKENEKLVFYDENNEKPLKLDTEHIYVDDNTGKYYQYDEKLDSLILREPEAFFRELLHRQTGIPKDQKGPIQFNGKYNHHIVQCYPSKYWGEIVQLPEHLLNHSESTLGTQVMKLLMENLSDDVQVSINIPGRGNAKLTYAEIYDIYQRLLWKNIKDGFIKVNATLNNPVKLLEFIKNSLQTQTNVDAGLEDCLNIDENGELIMPINNPLRSQKFLSFCCSLIRKEMIKQTIHQGLLPQVSSFGLEDQLMQRYQDEEGHMLFTRREFMSAKYNEKTHKITMQNNVVIDKRQFKFLTEMVEKYRNEPDPYKAYLANEGSNATRILYQETATPIFDQKILDEVLLQNGYIDEKLLDTIMSAEARDMVGYRTPTEAMHSILAGHVKLFLPQQNAGAIVLAPDWVIQSGSDFDADKLSSMFYHLEAYNPATKLLDDYFKSVFGKDKSIKDMHNDEDEIKLYYALRTVLRRSLQGRNLIEESDSDEREKQFQSLQGLYDSLIELFKKEKPYIKPIKFNSKELTHDSIVEYIEKNSKESRDNLMLSIYNAIITTEENTNSLLTPNGFEEHDETSVLMQVLELPEDQCKESDIPSLLNTSKKELKNILKKNDNTLSYASPSLRTIEQQRNMTGLQMVALSALYRVFIPIIQRCPNANVNQWETGINEKNEIVNVPHEFFIDNNKGIKKYGNIAQSMNLEGFYTALVVGDTLASSVDNAKNPILGNLALNTKNLPFAMYLFFKGYKIKQVAMFLKQPAIVEVFETSLETGESVEKVIQKVSKKMLYEAKIKQEEISLVAKDLGYTELPLEDLALAIHRNANNTMEESDYILQLQALKYLKNIITPSDELNTLVSINRSFTDSGSVSANEADNIENYNKLVEYKERVRRGANVIKNVEPIIPEINNESDVENSAIASEIGLRWLSVEKQHILLGNISIGISESFRNVMNYANSISNKKLTKGEMEDMLTFMKAYIFRMYTEYYNEDNPLRESMKEFLIIDGITEDIIENSSESQIKARIYKDFPIFLRGLIRFNLRHRNDPKFVDNFALLDHLFIDESKMSSNQPVINIKQRHQAREYRNQARIEWRAMMQDNNKYVVKVYNSSYSISPKVISDLLFWYGLVNNGPTPNFSNVLDLFPNGEESNINYWNDICRSAPTAIGIEDAEKVVDMYVCNTIERTKLFDTIDMNDYKYLSGIEDVKDYFTVTKGAKYSKYIKLQVENMMHYYKFDEKNLAYSRIYQVGIPNVFLDFTNEYYGSMMESIDQIDMSKKEAEKKKRMALAEDLENRNELIGERVIDEQNTIEDAVPETKDSEEKSYPDEQIDNAIKDSQLSLFGDDVIPKETDENGFKRCNN